MRHSLLIRYWWLVFRFFDLQQWLVLWPFFFGISAPAILSLFLCVFGCLFESTNNPTKGVYTRISYYYDWIQETICELATGTEATLDYNSLPEGITCPGSSSSTTSGGNTNNNNNNPAPAPAPVPQPPTRVPTPPVAAPVSFPTSSSSGGGYYEDEDTDYYFDDGGAYTTDWVSVDEFLEDATTWFCSFFGCRRRT